MSENRAMGFSLSWVAFRHLAEAEALRRTGLVETGAMGTAPPTREAPFAFCAFPTGWAAIFAADYRYASAAALGHLSAGVEALGCQIEEHLMFSAAAFFVDGLPMWHVSHDAQKSLSDLESSGALPKQYAPLRDEMTRKQGHSRAGRLATDFVWEVPVMLAHALTGQRHDLWKLDWGVATFERLDVAR